MTRALRPAEPLALGAPLEFLRRLWQVNHAIERVSSHMVRTLGVTAQQRIVLRILGRCPGTTAGRLASELHLDPGTISNTLGNLVRRGLVARRPDPTDGRSSSLRLTVAGRSLVRPAAGTVEGAVLALLRATPRARLAAADAALAHLVGLLDARAAPRPPVRSRRRR